MWSVAIYITTYLVFECIANIFYTVPKSVPEGVSSHVLSSRSFYLTWSPPEPEGRNGEVTRYAVLVSPNSITFYTNQLRFDFPTQGFIVQPHHTYFVQVAAETVVGRGPFSEQSTIYTPEDGRKMHAIKNISEVYSMSFTIPVFLGGFFFFFFFFFFCCCSSY